MPLPLIGYATWRLLQVSTLVVHYETAVPADEARRTATMLAEALAEAQHELLTDLPGSTQIFVYATTARYCAATHAPWWQSALTLSDGTHLQPPATLARRGGVGQVLRHEALHIVARHRRGKAWPRWREEGEAVVFSGEPTARLAGDLLPTLADVERALDQPRSPEASRRAYLSAGAFVSWLRQHRGVEGADACYDRFRSATAGGQAPTPGPDRKRLAP